MLFTDFALNSNAAVEMQTSNSFQNLLGEIWVQIRDWGKIFEQAESKRRNNPQQCQLCFGSCLSQARFSKLWLLSYPCVRFLGELWPVF